MSAISRDADTTRGHVIALAHALIAPRVLTKEEQLALERLVFELDRLASRCEELHAPKDR
jgi:hypothetical protein